MLKNRSASGNQVASETLAHRIAHCVLSPPMPRHRPGQVPGRLCRSDGFHPRARAQVRTVSSRRERGVWPNLKLALSLLLLQLHCQGPKHVRGLRGVVQPRGARRAAVGELGHRLRQGRLLLRLRHAHGRRPLPLDVGGHRGVRPPHGPHSRGQPR
jgi:hypothetical protein